MMNFSRVNRLIELLPEEIYLVRQAKSGDTRAFIKLYDAYIECVYRYINIQVIDDRVAEGLAFQTFFNAWKQLDALKASGLPFISWLYLIAQNQVNVYYRTHKNPTPPSRDLLISADSHLRKEIQAIRDALRFFTEEERQVLILRFIVCMPTKNIARLMMLREGEIDALQTRALQILAGHLEGKEIKIRTKKLQRILAEFQTKFLNDTSTLDEQLARYPEDAAQLEPLLRTILALINMRGMTPLPTFVAYTREALLNYMLSRPQRLRRRMEPSWRISFAFTALIVAFLITGTVQAQSALPGQPLYVWKQASELVWRAVSLDLTATDIILADRRLGEWIAVADDPTLGDSAMDSYLEAISRLQSTSNRQDLTRIVSVLKSQQRTLNRAGLASNELQHYLNEAESAVVIVPVTAATQPQVQSTTTRVPPTATRIPPTMTRIPPTMTNIPPTMTNIPPTVTNIPPTMTNIPPTATNIPPTETEVPPTETEVPPTETEPPPTETEPPPTETEPPPTETESPPIATEIPPIETEIPPLDVQFSLPEEVHAPIAPPFIPGERPVIDIGILR